MARPLFVSYASEDRPTVLPLVEALRSSGYGLWVDLMCIGGGNDWLAEIARAIESCSVFMLMLSPRAVVSHVVAAEVRLAFEHRKRILPVYLEPTDVGDTLRLAVGGIQALHLDEHVKSPFDEVRSAVAQLLKGQGRELRDERGSTLLFLQDSRSGVQRKIFLHVGARLGLGRDRPEINPSVDIALRVLPCTDRTLHAENRRRSALISHYHVELEIAGASCILTNFGKHGVIVEAATPGFSRSSLSAPRTTPDLTGAETNGIPAGGPADSLQALGPGDNVLLGESMTFTLGRDLLRLRANVLRGPNAELEAVQLQRLDNWQHHDYVLLNRGVDLALDERQCLQLAKPNGLVSVARVESTTTGLVLHTPGSAGVKGRARLLESGQTLVLGGQNVVVRKASSEDFVRTEVDPQPSVSGQ